MTTSYARSRGKEAPMTGIEFTNRTTTIPAWRPGANTYNTPQKRTHSDANPPPSPFEPPKEGSASRHVFGDNIRYLFRPEIQGMNRSCWNGLAHSTPVPDVPEVVMMDPESPPKARQPEPTSLMDIASPERAPEEESADVRQINNKAVRRVQRARRNEHQLRRRGRVQEVGSGDESEDEENAESPKRITHNTSNHYTLNMPGSSPNKPDMAYVLSGYLQFSFNTCLALVAIYCLIQFIWMVQHDVRERISEYSLEIQRDISTCTALYTSNLCATTPIPAMLHQCAQWDLCMSRDPKVVGRAKVSAEMLAEVVNGFVEPISWKTLIFSLVSIAFLTVFVNTLITFYRTKHQPGRHVDPVGGHHYAPLPYAPYPLPGMIAGDLPKPWLPPAAVPEQPPRRRRLENGDAAPVQ